MLPALHSNHDTQLNNSNTKCVAVFDLELTCGQLDNGHVIGDTEMEIIEIGAVLFDPVNSEVIGEYSTFIKPTNLPVITSLCHEITGIKQSQIDEAKDFVEVWPEFVRFIGEAKLMSWGKSDFSILSRACAERGIAFSMYEHECIKTAFAKQRKIKQVGINKALEILKIKPVGEAHRALTDANHALHVAMNIGLI